MPTTEDVRHLYTQRAHSYDRSVQVFGHRQGLAAVLASSDALHPELRVLDAGCGTGLSIIALNDALRRRGLSLKSVEGFDLTPAMLDRCRSAIQAAGVPRVDLRQADALRLREQLPSSWQDYDLITCVSVLEHMPRGQLTAALTALGERLARDGCLIMVVTRELFFATRLAWRCEGYSRAVIRSALTNAGLADITFRHYPWTHGWLNVADHVVEARRKQDPAA